VALTKEGIVENFTKRDHEKSATFATISILLWVLVTVEVLPQVCPWWICGGPGGPSWPSWP